MTHCPFKNVKPTLRVGSVWVVKQWQEAASGRTESYLPLAQPWASLPQLPACADPFALADELLNQHRRFTCVNCTGHILKLLSNCVLLLCYLPFPCYFNSSILHCHNIASARLAAFVYRLRVCKSSTRAEIPVGIVCLGFQGFINLHCWRQAVS